MFSPSPSRGAPKPPEPRQPRRFKVVDVMTREVLAEDADTRTTVKLLDDVRSIVDVTISVWQPETERWRMLTLEEARSLWEYRGRSRAASCAIVRPRRRKLNRSWRRRSPCSVELVADGGRSRRIPRGDARQPEATTGRGYRADHP